MKINIIRFILSVLVTFWGVSYAIAGAFNVDPNANEVYLRMSCSEGDGANTVVLDNCFDTIGDLVTWIDSRVPSQQSPLVVAIGAGEFDVLKLNCNGGGHTTFRGSGVGTTRISGADLTGCGELVFEHLTIERLSLFAAVRWTNNTSVALNSRWNDVELIGRSYAWYEISNNGGACTDGVQSNAGQHYWVGSRLRASGGNVFISTYRDACGSENWFIGSEIIADSGGSSSPYSITAISQDSDGETHVYGSVIRTLVDSVYASTNPGQIWCNQPMPSVLAACAAFGGNIHIHGTGIDVISSVANDIGALATGPGSGSFIHANETSYVLKDAGGSTTRLTVIDGDIAAPYAWQPSASPPDIVSTEGSDQVIVVAPGQTPRMLVYSLTCQSDWFEVNANTCYQP